ncbi:hypothetical protein, partial [Vibrio sp. DNB22_19_2]
LRGLRCGHGLGGCLHGHLVAGPDPGVRHVPRVHHAGHGRYGPGDCHGLGGCRLPYVASVLQPALQPPAQPACRRTAISATR